MDQGGTEEGVPRAPSLIELGASPHLNFVIVTSLQVMCGLSGFKDYVTPELAQIMI